MSWKWCFYFPETGPFWYLVLDKPYNHSVIIHLWRVWRWIFVKKGKIHWKLIIFKSQYCFANISATKAPIFMKFEINSNKIVKILAHTPAHEGKTCARTFCARIFTKIFLIILYYLINESIKFPSNVVFYPRAAPKVPPKWIKQYELGRLDNKLTGTGRQAGRRTDRTTYWVRLTLWLKIWFCLVLPGKIA